MTVRVLLMVGSMDTGGSENQTALLLNHLDRRRFSPELYLSYRRGPWLARIPPDVPIHAADDMPVTAAWNWPGRIHGLHVRNLRKLVQDRRIDVVYERSLHMTLIAAPACRGLIGRVSTIVSPPDQDLPKTEPRFLVIKRGRLAAAYRRAHHVVAVSDAVRRSSIAYYGIDPSHISVLHSPVDLADLRQRAKEPLGWDLSQDEFNICCVGRMTREKGQDLLIDAIPNLMRQPGLTQRPVRVWFAGDGPLRENLVQQAEAAGVSERVRFVGLLESAAPLIARCDLLVCPSRYEGLPNVILEAFALQVPVVACAVGGIGEIVKQGSTGRLVHAEDPQALAKAIRAVMIEREQTASQVAEAARVVDDQFALAPYVARIEEHLSSAAVKRSASS